MTKSKLIIYLTGIFVGMLLVSNLIANRVWNIGNIMLPAAVFTFPFVFIVNDILAEVYGFKQTRNIIILGFVINFIAVCFYMLANILPYPSFIEDTANAYKIALSTTLRVLIASVSAYFIGGLINAKIMEVMHKKHGEKKFSSRAVLSTLFGEFADGITFISIMFIGVLPIQNVLVMMLLQPLLKTIIEIIVLPVTTKVVIKIKTLPK